jgi:hypothetical protein
MPRRRMSVRHRGADGIHLRCEPTPKERGAAKSARYVLWEPAVGDHSRRPGGAEVTQFPTATVCFLQS